MSLLKTTTAKGTVKVKVAARGGIQENRRALVKVPKPKRASRVVDHNILAERSQAIMPVGAWVEDGVDCQEHPAILASMVEELQMQVLREKEENLREFQEQVHQRVAQQARVRKRLQLQKACEMAEREERVLRQTSEAAQNLTLRKGAFSACPQGELAICSSRSRRAPSSSDWNHAENMDEHQLNKAVRQVRRKLASCQTVQDGEEISELPGGSWKVSPTRNKPLPPPRLSEGEEEEILLLGQHDRPLDLQNQSEDTQTSKTVTFQSIKEPYPSGPTPTCGTDYRASGVLWPGKDEEELKRQRQSQFLMYRRHFMDSERAQVKELHRHKKHLRRIERIKADREERRVEEEMRIQRLAEMQEDLEEAVAKRERRILEEERALEERTKKERAQKDREATRFVKALRALMRERMAQEKVDLPPLCCCGESFWDTHPDTCANNCVFYGNPKAYAQALQSALLSSDIGKEGLSHRAAAKTMASIHTLSPRK